MQTMALLIVLLLAIPATAGDLEQILACNDQAVGGDRMRDLRALEYQLTIQEPGFAVKGIYKAERSGEMRIDVFDGDRRVFSEWLTDGAAWQLTADAKEPARATAEGTAALRHGLERPGRFWTLADMSARGHVVELVERERIGGVDEFVLKLTLDDGFETWLWVNAESCLVERSRNYRAFHPDSDPEKIWTETVYDQFERVDGLMIARRTRTIDLASGETLGTTEVTRITHVF